MLRIQVKFELITGNDGKADDDGLNANLWQAWVSMKQACKLNDQLSCKIWCLPVWKQSIQFSSLKTRKWPELHGSQSSDNSIKTL